MRPRVVVFVAGLIATVAMGQLIANVAVGQEAQDAPERSGTARVSVDIAPTATPAPAAQPVNATSDRSDDAPLDMSVVNVEPRNCPDEENAKTRLGLLERSAVNSLCD